MELVVQRRVRHVCSREDRASRLVEAAHETHHSIEGSAKSGEVGALVPVKPPLWIMLEVSVVVCDPIRECKCGFEPHSSLHHRTDKWLRVVVCGVQPDGCVVEVPCCGTLSPAAGWPGR